MRFLAALLFSALLAGCASTVFLMPVAGNDQRLTYSNGDPVLASIKTHVVILRIPGTVIQSGKDVDFAISINNPTSSDVLFSTENVTASWKGTPLKVYSFEEMMADEQRQQSIQRTGLALQAFGAALSGGTSTTREQGSYTTTLTGPGGTARGYGTYSGDSTTYDPAAGAVANAAVNQQIRSFQSDAQRRIAYLDHAMLRKHTVAPNSSHGGLVRVQMPPAGSVERILVTVTIPPDTHTFAVDVRPTQR